MVARAMVSLVRSYLVSYTWLTIVMLSYLSGYTQSNHIITYRCHIATVGSIFAIFADA